MELLSSAAERAKERISEVVVGDVEEIALPWSSSSFDVLILSEVLEHLVDPWAVLKKLWPLLTWRHRVCQFSQRLEPQGHSHVDSGRLEPDRYGPNGQNPSSVVYSAVLCGSIYLLWVRCRFCESGWNFELKGESIVKIEFWAVSPFVYFTGQLKGAPFVIQP